MSEKSRPSDIIQQTLLHCYNLLDLLKLGYINSHLLRTVASQITQLLFRIQSPLLTNTVSGLILGTGYILRCLSIVAQHQTTINNSNTLDQIAKNDEAITISDHAHVYRQLANSRVERVAQTFIFFSINLSMFYITSYQIINLVMRIFSPLFPILACITQSVQFIALLCGLYITYLKTEEFHHEQENTKRFTNLITQQKIIIQHPNQEYYLLWASRLILALASISAAYLILKSSWILYASGAIIGAVSISWMIMNRQLISSHWLPYCTGIMSAISAYTSLKTVMSVHHHLSPTMSHNIVNKCIDQCAITLGLIYGYSVKNHETQHKCVETLLESQKTSSTIKK